MNIRSVCGLAMLGAILIGPVAARFSKARFVLLSASVYGAALADMRQTLEVRHSLGGMRPTRLPDRFPTCPRPLITPPDWPWPRASTGSAGRWLARDAGTSSRPSLPCSPSAGTCTGSIRISIDHRLDIVHNGLARPDSTDMGMGPFVESGTEVTENGS
jgi:hypothetical protein